jgi:NADH-quinone oxidoreductase subunit F
MAVLKEHAAAAKAAVHNCRLRILVCAGTGCVANGALDVYERLSEKLRDVNDVADVVLHEGDLCGGEAWIGQGVALKHSGCHGFCEMGPLVRFEPSGLLYCKVKPEDVDEIIACTVQRGEVVERLLYKHPVTEKRFARQDEIPFYARQTRLTLANCGHLDPDDINEYFAYDGYAALAKAVLEMTPQQVIDEIAASKLRGRGGAGFPTARKWAAARQEPADVKYVICNGDEGDPGAFMDRSVMEGDPHRIVEGLLIAGYAVGAAEGYIYVRAEYPLAVKRLYRALDQARAHGLLGKNILGTDFSFELHIKEGAGAFVCGEESALIASVEGERGMPRPKPPFPAQKGLWGKPTVINNVETLAAVPYIVLHGAESFKQYGSEQSPGTKTFALTGDVANTGLIEVPMGLTLREVVFDIGGGVRQGKEFKAVQIGGPSGGCLTKEHLDLPLDYDSLQKAGAMIGSGGLVVMDDDTCMVDVARFFMGFTQNESCGKCVLCREGTRRMLDILERIVIGEGRPSDLNLLDELGCAVKEGSLCGLGKTAPNPVLTTMKHFRSEYLAHVENHRCPAHVCEALRIYRIMAELCKGCGRCARVCPAGAISGKIKEPFTIDPEKCIRCGACVEACRFDAIEEVV